MPFGMHYNFNIADQVNPLMATVAPSGRSPTQAGKRTLITLQNLPGMTRGRCSMCQPDLCVSEIPIRDAQRCCVKALTDQSQLGVHQLDLFQ